ncbi:MAG: NAD-dependent epimerase/dehydratase family protein, partial [Ignavibacteriaceae bacterium]
AKKSGMQILTETEALSIRTLIPNVKSTKRMTNINGLPFRYEVKCRDTKSDELFAVKTKLIILGGGTIGTAKLLLNSKKNLHFLGDHVGKNIAFNGSVKTIGLLPDGLIEGDMFSGRSHPGMISYHFFDSHGITISSAKPLPITVVAAARLMLEGENRNPLYWGEANVDLMKKFIFVSSLAGHQFLQQPIINESCLTESEQYFSKYAESKAKAEKLVCEYSKSGLKYIIIYPTRVFGIGPLTDANGATKAIYLYLKNRLPFLIDGGEQFSSWAFVEDVARGIILAANSNMSNQRYILGGENKTLAYVYRLADKIYGKKHLKVYLKIKSALRLASVLEFNAKLMRKKPIITREWLSFVLDSYKISSEKAITELNYNITPIETALEKTINWLKTL